MTDRIGPAGLIDDARLRVSIDSLLEGVQVIGRDWTYLYVNRTAAEHSQRPAEELLGRTMMACYPGIEQSPMFAALEAAMASRQPSRLLNEFTYPDGSSRWFDLLIEPVPDGVCVLSVDVTERQSALRQLEQAQKLEAIGQLAGGIAHDFNNMLTAILGYADLITEQIGPDKPIGRDLKEIVVAAEHAAAMTRQLLAFSRREVGRVEPLVLADIVTRLEPMLRRLLPEHIAIHVVLPEPADTICVLADRTQVEQVLINLVVNARDAMPEGGALWLEASAARLDEEYAADHPGVTPGTYQMLTVRDTGSGIPREIMGRIFEPFFTTKAQDRGTGLGLASVKRIVDGLGGHVFVYSEPGHGTVFRIYLPRSEKPAPEAPRVPRAAARMGRETILLAEDEPGVRNFVCRVLERHGYTVLAAPSSESALAQASARGGAIDLLLTDLMLPGMDGAELALRVRGVHPDASVIFMSGYSASHVKALPTGAKLIEKPFTAAALLEMVRTALDS